MENLLSGLVTEVLELFPTAQNVTLSLDLNPHTQVSWA